MYRSNGAGLILIISSLGAIIVLSLMTIEKRWNAVSEIVLGFILYVYAWQAISNIPFTNERILMAIPFMFIIPIALSPFLFIWSATTSKEKLNKRWERLRNRKVDPIKKRRGDWQLLIGFTIWLYWTVYPNLSDVEMALTIVLWCYPTVLGLQNVLLEQEPENKQG